MAKPNKKKEQPASCESCEEYKQGWQRALADYENIKKDMAVQLEASRKRIKAEFALDLLPVIDNFAQAVAHAPDLPEQQAWLDGVLYIQKQFQDVLGTLGVEQISTSGQFDPHLHETVGSEFDESKPDEEILREIQPGWTLQENVLRPAKVIINSKEQKNN